MEVEHNGAIPFLDLTISKINDRFDFDIFRKDTNTDRCIPATSYHSKQTKFAAFNSFCFRAINIPLNEDNFQKEANKIRKIAQINGFNPKIIDNLFKI